MKRTRKEPCDGVDIGALATALVAYAKCKDDAREAFDLLSYKVKNMGDKPSPQCLVKREQLLRVVLQHSTHGRVRQTDLQQSMDLVVKLLQIKPLPTIRNEDFCCLVSHKLRVMLYDLRAMRRSCKCLRAALNKLSMEEQCLLQGLVDSLGSGTPRDASFQVPVDEYDLPILPDISDVEPPTVEYDETPAKKPKQCEDSPIMVTHKEPFKPKGLLELSDDDEGAKHAFEQAKSVCKAAPVLAKAKDQKELVRKPMAQCFQPEARRASQQWSQLKVTYARQPPRAYITGYPLGCCKRTLLVEVTEKMSPRYEVVIQRILSEVQEGSLSKAEALQLRAQLVSKP